VILGNAPIAHRLVVLAPLAGTVTSGAQTAGCFVDAA
jgi:hypothetical protein